MGKKGNKKTEEAKSSGPSQPQARSPAPPAAASGAGQPIARAESKSATPAPAARSAVAPTSAPGGSVAPKLSSLVRYIFAGVHAKSSWAASPSADSDSKGPDTTPLPARRALSSPSAPIPSKRFVSIAPLPTAFAVSLPSSQPTAVDEVIKIASQIPQKAHFTTFNPVDNAVAVALYSLLLSLEAQLAEAPVVPTGPQLPPVMQVLSVVAAAQAKAPLNPGLIRYATAVFLAHAKDTDAQTVIPEPITFSPFNFFNNDAVFSEQEVDQVPNPPEPEQALGNSTPFPDVPPPDPEFQTFSTRDLESRVAYWREDPFLNSHHYHWHIVYPSGGTPVDPRNPQSDTFLKDRQPELFAFMHQQMLARYDAERLGANLRLVRALDDWDEPLEGYDAHLTSVYGASQFAPRPAGLKLPRRLLLSGDTDASDTNVNMPLSLFAQWRDRVDEAADSGRMLVLTPQADPDHREDEPYNAVFSYVPTTVNRLSGVIEANIGSLGKKYYGNIHNMGHMLISSTHDPERLLGSALGVMGFLDTAIRDPLFFRWHRFIDNFFWRLRDKNFQPNSFAPPKQPLVNSVQCKFMSDGTALNAVKDAVAKNEPLPAPPPTGQYDVENAGATFMRCDTFKLNELWDTTNELSETQVADIPTPRALAKVWMLDHIPCQWQLEIDAAREFNAVIRIWMAPNHSPTAPMTVRTFIEMDKFVKKLSKGVNKISRTDFESSVTIQQPEKDQLFNPNDAQNIGLDEQYCKCGLPRHLLLPRGRIEGMGFQVFVMVSDWDEDRAMDDAPCCGSEYCGLRNKKYPDRRPMGYPFDRKWEPLDPNEPEFNKFFYQVVKKNSNMTTFPINISFLGSLKPSPPENKVSFEGNYTYSDTHRDASGQVASRTGKLVLKRDPYANPPIVLVGTLTIGADQMQLAGIGHFASDPPRLDLTYSKPGGGILRYQAARSVGPDQKAVFSGVVGDYDGALKLLGVDTFSLFFDSPLSN